MQDLVCDVGPIFGVVPGKSYTINTIIVKKLSVLRWHCADPCKAAVSCLGTDHSNYKLFVPKTGPMYSPEKLRVRSPVSPSDIFRKNVLPVHWRASVFRTE